MTYSRTSPLEDVYLNPPQAALRYLVFRAEHRDGWCRARTIDRWLTVSLRFRTPEIEEGAEMEPTESLQAALSHATRQPKEAEIFEVTRDLKRLGFDVTETTRNLEKRGVLLQLARCAPRA